MSVRRHSLQSLISQFHLTRHHINNLREFLYSTECAIQQCLDLVKLCIKLLSVLLELVIDFFKLLLGSLLIELFLKPLNLSPVISQFTIDQNRELVLTHTDIIDN